jgi:uncharacterized membrane protein YeaQ/YmgE (transglycosylase-associated protein family)
MNIMIWVLAGAAAGWVGYSYMNLNEDRGMLVSVLIGAVGGFFGGKVLAPAFGAVIDASNSFSLFSLIIALAAAAGCLAIGNLLSDRYGV